MKLAVNCSVDKLLALALATSYTTNYSIIIVIIIIIIIITTIIITKSIKHEWNKKNHVSIQHINLYELSEVTTSIIKYTSTLILNCLQELINNLLNLQTMYPIATNESYQSFITHHKTKIETIPGSKYSY